MRPVKNISGFTLIEIVSVLVILGVLAAVAVTRSGGGGSDLAVIEAALKNHIRYAQSKAMFSDARVWGIQIDTGNDDYWLVRADRGQALAWAGTRIQPFGADGSDAGFNRDRIRTSRVNVDIGGITGGAGASARLSLLFDSMGVPFWFTGGGSVTIADPLSDSPGLTRLASGISVPLSDNKGNSRTITITQETGFIP